MRSYPITDHVSIKRTICKNVWDLEMTHQSHWMFWKTFVKDRQNTLMKYSFKTKICSFWIMKASSICILLQRALLNWERFMLALWSHKKWIKRKPIRLNCSKFSTADTKCHWLDLGHGKFQQMMVKKLFTTQLNVGIATLTVLQSTKTKSKWEEV